MTNQRQQQFKTLKELAGDKLVSSFSEFANQRTLLTFMCDRCGTPFKSTAFDYHHKQSCSRCVSVNSSLVRSLRAKHGDYYDYSNLSSIDTTEPLDPSQILEMRCPKHGLFTITLGRHLIEGYGCDHCLVENVSTSNKLTTYINQAHHAHNFNYRYDKVTQLGPNNIIVTCPKHGDFDVDPQRHLDGRGCSICEQSGKVVSQITEMLTKRGITFSTEKTFPGCVSEQGRALRFNVYIPQKNMCIEVDGVHHFQPTKYSDDVTDEQANRYYDIQTRNDNIKHTYCEQHGIHLVRIPYTEFNPSGIIDRYLDTLPDKRVIHSWADFEIDIERVVNYIKTFNYGKFAIYGVSRGGVPFAVHISNHFEDACEFGVVGFQRYDGNDKTVTHQIQHKTDDLPIFVIDDLISSGITMQMVVKSLKERYPNAPAIHPIVIFGAHNDNGVFYIREHPKQWIVFPYEV